MSAAWIKLLTILCLTCTVLSDPGRDGVVWRKSGEDITIQCRTSQKATYVILNKGLSQEVQIFYKNRESNKDNIAKEVINRLQLNGAFPNMDFLIKNLTSADTGPYWCVFKMFEIDNAVSKVLEGNGSILLVVTDERSANPSPSSGAAKQECEKTHLNLVLVCVVVSVAVLLCFIVIALTWIFIKTKKLHSTVKPTRVTTNDVYEEMRGTLRH
ncbi:uncharacterized protein LOC111645887 [Seriola lalandi dorsalis]|uniref:uncharacterized protein LOC111645887 n=1 Tax=Seriola lalandi dorsalis TaxID=1841481 RepID=UPI000C6FA6D3|nr:uncharacterized protein LOC111645887 [Seriola lalandi dorsalis]XP_056257636.1 uncharacterized protein LOC130185284 [Seriola aureovittata]